MTPVETPPPLHEASPFWTYTDFALFVCLSIPSVVLSLLTALALGRLAPIGKPVLALLTQLLVYAFLFGALYLILKLRYGKPFWRSLGWRAPFPGMLACAAGGPLLAIALGIIGRLIRTPEIKLPLEDLAANLPTTVLLAIIVVVLGPVAEELVFRGFLMPLIARSFGVATGILATALVFGALHAFEYQWSWRHVLLISTAGAVFGWVRHAADSTAASALMHAGFNMLQFTAFLVQMKTHG
jgi:membrane protease YdiL (CAAX protease family)